MPSSLDEFKEALREVSGVTKTALAGISALPIISLAVDLSPPWPRGTPVVTCLVELVVLMLSFHYARLAKEAVVSKTLLLASSGLALSSLVYFSLLSLFVYDAPNGDRFVKGYECTVEAELIFSQACPLLPKNLIREANYDSDRLWTQLSILGARLALLVSWSAMFMCISALTGCFVVYHMKLRKRKMRNLP